MMAVGAVGIAERFPGTWRVRASMGPAGSTARRCDQGFSVRRDGPLSVIGRLESAVETEFVCARSHMLADQPERS